MLRAAMVSIFSLLLISSTAAAQLVKGDMRASVNAGLGLPLGDYADDKGEDAGGATMGFTVGGEFDYVITSSGLIWTSSVSIVRNGFDEDVLDFDSTVDVDAGAWYQIPIMSGLKYEAAVSPTVDIYGQGQLGMNFFRPPGADLTQGEATGEIETDSGTSFGFCLGGGAVFNDHFGANVRILLLGKPDIDATFTSGGESQSSESETGITLVTLTGSYRF